MRVEVLRVVTEENHLLGHVPAVTWQICSHVSEEPAVSITLMMVPLKCWYIPNTLQGDTTQNMVFFSPKCSDNFHIYALTQNVIV